MVLDNFRRWLAKKSTAALRQQTTEIDAEALGASAIVFAPHPDDEVLGCGGTIIAKRQAGAHVTIVFLTDGSRSPRYILPDALRLIRQEEALEAARRLGVSASDVLFLDFEDRRLAAKRDEAIARVKSLLRDVAPAQIFAPWAFDAHADHTATHQIARRAMAACPGAALYEYSVYLWAAWPWSRRPRRGGRLAWFLDSGTVHARAFAQMSHFVRVDVARKRTALEAHRSQMERPAGTKILRTLDGWSNGDFLEGCLCGIEFFAKTR